MSVIILMVLIVVFHTVVCVYEMLTENSQKIQFCIGKSLSMLQNQVGKKTFLIYQEIPTKENLLMNKIVGHLVCNFDNLWISERSGCYTEFKVNDYIKKNKFFKITLPDGITGYVETEITNHACRLENTPKQMKLDNNLPFKEVPSLILVADNIRLARNRDMFRVIVTLFVFALIIKLLSILGRAIFRPFAIILDGLEASNRERNNLNKYIGKSFVVSYPSGGWPELIFKTKDFAIKNSLRSEGDLDVSHLVGKLTFNSNKNLSENNLKLYDKITVTSVYNKSRLIQVSLDDGSYGFMEASALDKMTAVSSVKEAQQTEKASVAITHESNEMQDGKIVFPSSVKIPVSKKQTNFAQEGD